jgi:hypothetical protein
MPRKRTSGKKKNRVKMRQMKLYQRPSNTRRPALVLQLHDMYTFIFTGATSTRVDQVPTLADFPNALAQCAYY